MRHQIALFSNILSDGFGEGRLKIILLRKQINNDPYKRLYPLRTLQRKSKLF